jgi:hypothetical protein
MQVNEEFINTYEELDTLWEDKYPIWPQEKYADFDKTLTLIAATYALVYSLKSSNVIARRLGLDVEFVLDLSCWSKYVAPKFSDMQAMLNLIKSDADLEVNFKQMVDPVCTYDRDKLFALPDLIKQIIAVHGQPCPTIRDAWSKQSSINYTRPYKNRMLGREGK